MEGSPAEQLQQIEKEYREKRAAVEQMQHQGELAEQAPPPTEHETLSRVVEGAIQQHVPAFQASSHTAVPTDDALSVEAQAQVQTWVKLAFEKGLDEGIKAAKNSNDIALIDAFHSALTGDLYRTLIDSKKLEAVK